MTMNWLQQQDVELARIRTKLLLPVYTASLRFLVGLGFVAEVALYVLTHDEIVKRIHEATSIGAVGWWLKHIDRREWTRKNKKRVEEILEERFDDDYIEDIFKRLCLDKYL